MRGIREFIREEDGVGVVELSLVNDIFDTITKKAGKV